MSESDPGKTGNQPPVIEHEPPGSAGFDFWLLAWLGTTIAGGLFGAVACFFGPEGPNMFLLGFFFGVIFAGLVATPLFSMIGTAVWALGLTRLRAAAAVLAGAATGVLATMPAAIGVGFGEAEIPILSAGAFGALGSGLAVLAWKRTVAASTAECQVQEPKRAPLKLAARLGVLAAVLAGWAAVFCVLALGVQGAREAARRSQCENQLKQIGLALQNYVQVHKQLPPAHLTDKAGRPVLSWRVGFAECFFYQTDFSECLGCREPWNSPKNRQFLDPWGTPFHCPSSGKKYDDPMTDFVAVVGPDTLWPGTVPGDLKKHPKGILVVEWPKSDIHWAEPRDVTVDEFLDWFRAKPPHRDSFHRGGLFMSMPRATSPRPPTDPETVCKMLVGG